MKTALIYCHRSNGGKPTDHTHTEWCERVEVLQSFSLNQESFFVYRNRDGSLNVTHRPSGLGAGSVFASTAAAAFKRRKTVILANWAAIQAATPLASRGPLPVIERTK